MPIPKRKKIAKGWLIPLHCWLMKLSKLCTCCSCTSFVFCIGWGCWSLLCTLSAWDFPELPGGLSYQCRLDSQDLSTFSKQKKSGTVLSGPEANYANLYIYVHTIFSLRLELLYSYTVCRKLSEICCMLNFHLCSFPSRLLYQKDTWETNYL